jgi:hypothetical protein
MPIKILPKLNPDEPSFSYPVLMQWRDPNPEHEPLVVLFITENSGSKVLPQGFEKVQCHWAPATSNKWRPFQGTLVFTT